VRLIFLIIVLCDLLENKLAKKIAFFRKDPAGIFDLVEVVGNGTYGQVHKVQCIQHLVFFCVLTKDSINALVICYATRVFYLYFDVP